MNPIRIRIRDSQIGLEWPADACAADVQAFLRYHGYTLDWSHIRRGTETWWCKLNYKWQYKFYVRGELMSSDEEFDSYAEAKSAGLADGLEPCKFGMGGRDEGVWYLEEVY